MNRMRTSPKDQDSQVIQLLGILQPVPSRQVERAQAARQNFLEQAAEVLSQNPILAVAAEKAPISATRAPARLTARLVVPLLVTLLIVFVGASLALAAQSSLPGQPLYPYKLWSEDLRLALSYSSPASWRLALHFSERRVDEILAVARAGGVPDDALLNRLEQQSDLAVAGAIQSGVDQAPAALQMLQERLQTQNRLIQQLEAGLAAQEPTLAALIRSRMIIQQRLNRVERYLQDPSRISPSLEPGISGTTAPLTTPAPLNSGGATAFPGGCQSCPTVGTPPQGTAAPASSQPTQAGAPSVQVTGGSQQNQTGSPANSGNQPPAPPEDPGHGPGEPQGPGPGGGGGK